MQGVCWAIFPFLDAHPEPPRPASATVFFFFSSRPRSLSITLSLWSIILAMIASLRRWPLIPRWSFWGMGGDTHQPAGTADSKSPPNVELQRVKRQTSSNQVLDKTQHIFAVYHWPGSAQQGPLSLLSSRSRLCALSASSRADCRPHLCPEYTTFVSPFFGSGPEFGSHLSGLPCPVAVALQRTVHVALLLRLINETANTQDAVSTPVLYHPHPARQWTSCLPGSRPAACHLPPAT